MILPIILYPADVLKQPTHPVNHISPSVRKLVADLFETLYKSGGIGLAAPQINSNLSVCVIDITGSERTSAVKPEVGPVSEDIGDYEKLCLINPTVVPDMDTVWSTEKEGCLSMPGLRVNVRRPNVIRVTALDEGGSEIKFSCSGWLSRVIQHEVDHLNGKNIVDHLKSK